MLSRGLIFSYLINACTCHYTVKKDYAMNDMPWVIYVGNIGFNVLFINSFPSWNSLLVKDKVISFSSYSGHGDTNWGIKFIGFCSAAFGSSAAKGLGIFGFGSGLCQPD